MVHSMLLLALARGRSPPPTQGATASRWRGAPPAGATASPGRGTALTWAAPPPPRGDPPPARGATISPSRGITLAWVVPCAAFSGRGGLPPRAGVEARQSLQVEALPRPGLLLPRTGEGAPPQHERGLQAEALPRPGQSGHKSRRCLNCVRTHPASASSWQLMAVRPRNRSYPSSEVPCVVVL
ncbi:hypothetical protein Salat_1648000 [Sesamum alatum]|uniref:Uncharacterized protein n=1 Tax=Sesamum alatum TaxID=300844 RepID=A0AAE1Y7B2_9LAMI|nr:hypothetical protein Salat_1648000 [Sesamum alatum]